MPKNLKESFTLFCNSKNLEVNQNQILVIEKLQNYYKKILNHSFQIFSQKKFKKKFLSLWRCWSWENNDFRFLFNQIIEKKKDFTLMNLC